MSKIPSYDEVSRVLAAANTGTGAAEAHGLLCGLICAGVTDNVDANTWARKVLVIEQDAEKLDSEQLDVLQRLFSLTREQFVEMALDFQLLLPDDEQPLTKRAEEFGLWCQGYLVALNLKGIRPEDGQTEETREALMRIADMADIEYRLLEVSEADEVAYMEVTEYVRLAVLMIYAEFAGKEISGGNQRVLH